MTTGLAAAVAGPTKVLSQLRPAAGPLLVAAATGFVILNLLTSYYSPQVVVPITGYMWHTFQIYKFDNGYSEENSKYYRAYVDRPPKAPPIIELAFPARDRFRLDFLGDGTIAFPGTLTTNTHSGLRVDTSTYRLDLSVVATHGLRPDPARGVFTFIAAEDPNLDISVSQLPLLSTSTSYSFCPVLYVVGPILLAWFLWKLRDDIVSHRALVIGMLCVCVFLSFVSLTLPYDHGPDEWSHIASGDWYLTHFFPPSMISPVYYNGWGWNYVVGTADLTYLLTFKAAHLIQMVYPMDLYRTARFSQIALCFGIFFLVLRFAQPYVSQAYLFGAVLVPQIAYTLTYVNGDILSYFLSIAALGILFAPKDLDNRIAIPICLFVLCNTKTNYLVLVPVALFILYRQYRFKYWPYVIAGLAIGSYRRVFSLVDEHIVGRTFLQNVLLHADAWVRTRLLSGHLEYSVLINRDFYKMSFESLYARFGYMNFIFPWYFWLVGVALAVSLLLAVDRRQRIFVAIVFFVNLGMSLYFSMSMEYQAQGRYLFPTVIVLLLIAASRTSLFRYIWYAIPTTLAITAFWLAYVVDMP